MSNFSPSAGTKAFYGLQLGETDVAYPAALARYGVRRTRDNRITGGHLNVLDVLSKYCQSRKDLTIERLDRHDKDDERLVRSAIGIGVSLLPYPQYTTASDGMGQPEHQTTRPPQGRGRAISHFAGGGTGETDHVFLPRTAHVSSVPTESSHTARAAMLGQFRRRLPSRPCNPRLPISFLTSNVAFEAFQERLA